MKEFTATTKSGIAIVMTADITERGEIQAQYQYANIPMPDKKTWKYVVQLDKAQAKAMCGVDLPATMKFAAIPFDDQPAFKAFLADAETVKAAWKAQEVQRAMSAKIVGFIYEIGCDAADTAEFVYDLDAELSFTAKHARKEADAALAKRIAAMVRDNHGGYETMPSTGSTYGGYKLTAAQVDALLSPAKAGEQADVDAKHAAAAKEESRIAAIFETAKTTGAKQVLDTYMAECHDRHEECSQDVVTVYAMPDGTTATERQHTW